jgi:hypothetical protein
MMTSLVAYLKQSEESATAHDPTKRASDLFVEEHVIKILLPFQ